MIEDLRSLYPSTWLCGFTAEAFDTRSGIEDEDHHVTNCFVYMDIMKTIRIYSVLTCRKHHYCKSPLAII